MVQYKSARKTIKPLSCVDVKNVNAHGGWAKLPWRGWGQRYMLVTPEQDRRNQRHALVVSCGLAVVIGVAGWFAPPVWFGLASVLWHGGCCAAAVSDAWA